MKLFAFMPLLVAALAAPADARITIFNFSGVVQGEDLNGDDVTGLGLLPVRQGDVIRGFFDFDDSIVGQVSSGRDVVAFFNNPTRQSEFQFFRDGTLALTVKLRPIIFGNGNPSDQSQINLIDGDPRSRRDSLSLSLQGGDPASGSVLELTPDFPEIEFAALDLSFREQCATGSLDSGNCVSNSPTLDFFNGSDPRVDFLRAFNDGGRRDILFTFVYRNGDFGSIYASFDSLSAIPEPQNWAMMIVGFASVGFVSRRRKHKGAVGQVTQRV